MKLFFLISIVFSLILISATAENASIESKAAASQQVNDLAVAENTPQEATFKEKEDDEIERQKKSSCVIQTDKSINGDPVSLNVNPNQHVLAKPITYAESETLQQNVGYGEPLKLGLGETPLSQPGYNAPGTLLPSHGDKIVPKPYRPPIPAQIYKPSSYQNPSKPQLWSGYGDQTLNINDSPQLLYDLPQHAYSPAKLEHTPNYSEYHAGKPGYVPTKPGYFPVKLDHAPIKSIYGSGNMDYIPEKPGYASAIPQYPLAKPEYVPGNSGYSPTKPGYAPVIPEYSPAKPEYPPGNLGHTSTKPGYNPAKFAYAPVKQEYAPVKPEYPASTFGYGQPLYPPVKPAYGPIKPVYSPIKPGYPPTKPTHGLLKPTYGTPYSAYSQTPNISPQPLYDIHSGHDSIYSGYNKPLPVSYPSYNTLSDNYGVASSNIDQCVGLNCASKYQMAQCQAGYGGYGAGFGVGGYGYGGSY